MEVGCTIDAPGPPPTDEYTRHSGIAPIVIGGRSNFDASWTVPELKHIFVASIVPDRLSPVMKLNRLMSVPVWVSCAVAEHEPVAPTTSPRRMVDALPMRRIRSPAKTRPR